MMINNGHKGMTQSSTFNYNQQLNGFYQPIYPNQQQYDPKYYQNNSYQYANQNGNYQPQPGYVNDKTASSGNQYYPNQVQKTAFMATAKSMKTSQDPNGEEFNRITNYATTSNKVTMSAIQNNSCQQQYSYQNQQQTSYIINPANPNIWYVPQ